MAGELLKQVTEAIISGEVTTNLLKFLEHDLGERGPEIVDEVAREPGAAMRIIASQTIIQGNVDLGQLARAFADPDEEVIELEPIKGADQVTRSLTPTIGPLIYLRLATYGNGAITADLLVATQEWVDAQPRLIAPELIPGAYAPPLA